MDKIFTTEQKTSKSLELPRCLEVFFYRSFFNYLRESAVITNAEVPKITGPEFSSAN